MDSPVRRKARMSAMNRRNAFTVLAFALGHLGLICVSMWFSLEGLSFDWPNSGPSIREQLGDIGVEVLGFPAFQLWEGLGAGKYAPDFLEWTLFFSNSLLWGVVLTALYRRVRRSR